MTHYTLNSKNELKKFFEERKGTRKKYVWGSWDNIYDWSSDPETLSRMKEELLSCELEEFDDLEIFEYNSSEVVLYETPDINDYPPVKTGFVSLFLYDYIQRTTFFDDFTIADAFGAEAVKETFNRAFREWKHDVVFITELTMVMNWKLWIYYKKKNVNLSRVYEKLFRELEKYCDTHLLGEARIYYRRTTD